MKFFFHKDAREHLLLVEGELYLHIFKSRRTSASTFITMRNMQDDRLYSYKCIQIDKKKALLELVDSINLPQVPLYPLHIILALIDTKYFEKILPMLNELGTKKITLFKSQYSQNNFKVDMQRSYKIAINSSQQCGRSDYVQIEEMNDLQEVLKAYPQSLFFDFGGIPLHNVKLNMIPSVIIGPEGGFSKNEKELSQHFMRVSTAESIVLKSETAAVYIQANAWQFYC